MGGVVRLPINPAVGLPWPILFVTACLFSVVSFFFLHLVTVPFKIMVIFMVSK